jgi:non-ribosomal peptide synthetase component E (peptide arylation enzyme)
VSGSSPFDSPEIRLDTDGLIAPGCEIRVIDPASGEDCRPGVSGEFLIRGPQRAMGYLSAEHTREGFDDDGWFRTGDLGFLDDQDAVTVTGRVKEIINRGGEKISGREIDLTAFLRDSGMASQKIPRVWRWVSQLPRTPSGKVKKFELQAALRQPEEVAG